jgi:hypothetical protein
MRAFGGCSGKRSKTMPTLTEAAEQMITKLDHLTWGQRDIALREYLALSEALAEYREHAEQHAARLCELSHKHPFDSPAARALSDAANFLRERSQEEVNDR